jgi:hypothetical protein
LELAIPVPDVTINGRCDPASAAPSSFDHAPIRFAVLHEFREVVIERRVNHRIRVGCPNAQAFEVFEIAAVHLGSGCGK